MNLKQALVLITICTMGLSNRLHAQTIYKINDAKGIDMKLNGTSTLHKWAMEAKTFDGQAQFGLNGKTITSVKDLSFSLEVQDLKSGEKGLDKNAYKALKTGQYKDITYKLTSATVAPTKDGKYLITTQGNLYIAGVTHSVAMNVTGVVNADGSVTCTGAYKLKMTDYQVQPPTFMLGAMKTGDDITLNYTLVYTK